MTQHTNTPNTPDNAPNFMSADTAAAAAAETTPILDSDYLTAETPEHNSAQTHTAHTETSAAASTDSAANTPETPKPFYTRTWVILTAPIVAALLLLGIGGSAGYAIGSHGDHGGRGAHSSESGDFSGRGGNGPGGQVKHGFSGSTEQGGRGMGPMGDADQPSNQPQGYSDQRGETPNSDTPTENRTENNNSRGTAPQNQNQVDDTDTSGLLS